MKLTMNRRRLAVAVGGAAVVAVAAIGTAMVMSPDSTQPAAQSGQLVNKPDTTTTNSSTAALPAPTTTSVIPSSSPRMVPPSTMQNKGSGVAAVRQSGVPTVAPATVAPKTMVEVALGSMPTGSVVFSRDSTGKLVAQVSLYGLTPGSVHTVEIDSNKAPSRITVFNSLKANDLGQAAATLNSPDMAALPKGSTFAIRLGPGTGAANDNPVADEIIAQTARLADNPVGLRYPLLAVDDNPNGTSAGTLAGKAMLTYDPNVHTLTVTLSASGLAPGPHAVHIHVGTCVSQGAVKYMSPNDFVADELGQLVNQTQVIGNVSSNPLVAGFYLNLHQGDHTTILRNNSPALAFRPLLCADV